MSDMKNEITQAMIAYKTLCMLFNGMPKDCKPKLGTTGIPRFSESVEFEIPDGTLQWSMDQFAQGVLLTPVYELCKKLRISTHGLHPLMGRKFTSYLREIYSQPEGMWQARAFDPDLGSVVLTGNRINGIEKVRIDVDYDVEEISPK